MSIVLNRQENIINLEPEELANVSVAIIGVGAIGRNLVEQLACMGIGKLVLFDGDKVNEANICNQGWKQEDIGKWKTHCVKREIQSINPDINVDNFKCHFQPNAEDVKHINLDVDIIACCVDDMMARKKIMMCAETSWEKDKICPVVEARAGLETLEVRCVSDQTKYNKWIEEWFPSDEAAEATCGSQGTIYLSKMCAGVMAHYISKLLSLEPKMFCKMMPYGFRLDLNGMGSDSINV